MQAALREACEELPGLLQQALSNAARDKISLCSTLPWYFLLCVLCGSVGKSSTSKAVSDGRGKLVYVLLGQVGQQLLVVLHATCSSNMNAM